MLLSTLIAQTSADTFGTLEAPPGVDKFNQASGLSGDQVAIFFFISRVLQIGTIIAGIWVVANIVMAGTTFISSSGDSKAATKVKDILTQSVVGLLLIITSYTVAGVIGLLLFGDATYLINPTFETM